MIKVIARLSKVIAKYILKELNKNDVDDVALEKKISICLIFLFVFVILTTAYLTFEFKEQIIISAISVMFLRMLNGGNHFKSPDVCCVVTSLSILINPLLGIILDNKNEMIFVYCLIVYIVFAPHTYINKFQYFSRKFASLIICVVVYYVCETILIAMFILSFDIIIKNPIFRRLSYD